MYFLNLNLITDFQCTDGDNVAVWRLLQDDILRSEHVAAAVLVVREPPDSD